MPCVQLLWSYAFCARSPRGLNMIWKAQLLILIIRWAPYAPKLKSKTKHSEVPAKKLVFLLKFFVVLSGDHFVRFFLLQTHMYSVSKSNFSRSDGYQNFFYYPSIMFGTLLPFILLTALNGFLIWTVRKSHQMRHTMTNTRQVSNKIIWNLVSSFIHSYIQL